MSKEPSNSGASFSLEGLINLFLRILSLIFICYSVLYWMLVVGFSNSEIRFDTMPLHWKLTATTLSVLYPIAALGLWGLFRWGIVIWFLTAAVELLMYVVYPHIFGSANTLVLFHISSIAVWLVYKFINFMTAKRARLA